MGFAGKAVTQTPLKIEPIGSQQKHENQLIYHTAISEFQNFENSENLENYQIKMSSENIIEFNKNEIYVKEPRQL